MKRSRLIRSAFTYGTAVALVMSVGFPLLWMVMSSLKPAAQLFTSPPQVLGTDLTLQWYRSVVLASDTPRLFMNSFLIALATTLICISAGSFAAYSVTRFDFPGKNVFMLGALISYVFPAIVLFVPVYFILNSIGLVDTLAGIVLLD
jgi:ABC-type glycerol-3-phosphate transport system permease component